MKTDAVPKEEKVWLLEYYPKLGRELTREQRAHLYVLRYLRTEARLKDLFCMLPGSEDYLPGTVTGHFGSKGRLELVILSNLEAYQQFGRHFFGAFGTWTSWWYNDRTDAMIAAMHEAGVPENVLAARFDFVLAHVFIFHYRGYYHHLPVWIGVGLAHIFERWHKGVPDTFPILGHIPEFDWQEKDWWGACKGMLTKGNDIPLLELALEVRHEKLKPNQHPQAWSLVNFMLGMGKRRFRTFMDGMKNKRHNQGLAEVQYDAIELAYGVNSKVFVQAWQGWVASTRPKKR